MRCGVEKVRLILSLEFCVHGGKLRAPCVPASLRRPERKAKAERVKGKAGISNLAPPSTFALFILIPDRSAFGWRGGA